MNAQVVHHNFAVILLGDGGVGKTTFFNKIIKKGNKAYYNRRYNYDDFLLQTNRGVIKITLFDTCGEQKFGGLRQAYFLHGDAAIIMFDVTSRITYKNIPRWYKDIIRIKQDIPIVVLGNKIDCLDRKAKPKHIKFPNKKNLPYFDVSVKCNYGFEKCLQFIARSLLKDQNTQIISPLQLRPTEKQIDKQIIQTIRREWKETVIQQISEDESSI